MGRVAGLGLFLGGAIFVLQSTAQEKSGTRRKQADAGKGLGRKGGENSCCGFLKVGERLLFSGRPPAPVYK